MFAKPFTFDASRYLMFGLSLGLSLDFGISRFLYIWDAKDPPVTLHNGFYGTVTTNFRGHKFLFSVTRFPMDTFFCQKPIKSVEEVRPGEDSQAYLKCQGYEHEQHSMASAMFNLTWGIVAPDRRGFLAFDNKTNTWTGTTSYVFYGKADLSSTLQKNRANRIHAPGTNLKPVETTTVIMAAAPKRISHLFAVTYPFKGLLWLCVAGFTILITAFMKILPQAQNKIHIVRTRDSRIDEREDVSMLFGFTALIGENMRDETSRYHSSSIR